jgi:hypothetical protein
VRKKEERYKLRMEKQEKELKTPNRIKRKTKRKTELEIRTPGQTSKRLLTERYRHTEEQKRE